MTLTRTKSSLYVVHHNGIRYTTTSKRAGHAIAQALAMSMCPHPRFISTPRSRSKKCGACGFITKEY